MAMINGNDASVALGYLSSLGATGNFTFTIGGREYSIPVELDENGKMIVPQAVLDEIG